MSDMTGFKNTSMWRLTSESESSLRVFFIFLALIFSSEVFARDPVEVSEAENLSSYYLQSAPYVPQKKDYGIELGAMSEEHSLYWLGVNFGKNFGTCFKIDNPYCQQYFDFGFGAGGREAETHYMGTLSARFQWVNFPSPWSPFARVIIGALNSIEVDKTQHHFLVGAGIGVTRQMHEHLDVRFELRGGYADYGFIQTILGLQLKIDRLVEFFADKLEHLGKGTAGAIESFGKKVLPTKNKEGDKSKSPSTK